MDATHDLGQRFYVRGEAEIIQRNYDTSRRERERTARLGVGYRTQPDQYFDRLNVEIFYQFRRRSGNEPDADFSRTQIGLQTTFYF